MHLPDGFLDARTAVAATALAGCGVGVALRQVRRSLPPRRIPLLGMASAFVFAAQMINFPVAGGTSGHLLGGVLAAVLLGPAAAVVVMTSVLILQCFLFQDGGLTALGANVFNMAILAPTVGYGVYAGLRRLLGGNFRSRLLATAFASWCSMMVAALACAGQLAASGTVAWGVAFPAMAGIHAVIGMGEAVITTLVVAAVARLRPELLGDLDPGMPEAPGALRWAVLQGLVAAFGLAIFVAPFACGWPDGLEAVAERLGFGQRAAVEPALPAPWPDYVVGGGTLNSVWLATVLAGVLGTAAAFGLSWVLARVLTRPTLRGARRSPTVGS